MSYLQFHVVFTIPALIIMRAIQPRIVLSDRRKANLSVGVIAVIAFLYTTPWDNFLVANNIWYYGTDRVIGIIGHVPFEEYAFFLIQTFITGLWTFWLLHRPKAQWFEGPASLAARINGTAFSFLPPLLDSGCSKDGHLVHGTHRRMGGTSSCTPMDGWRATSLENEKAGPGRIHPAIHLPVLCGCFRHLERCVGHFRRDVDEHHDRGSTD